MIEEVVLLTWKEYHNYQKIWGVLVMSTTLPPVKGPWWRQGTSASKMFHIF
jgi:hypothetical protein